MRHALWIAALGLLPTAMPLACGSLAEGEVVIVDENAGAPSGGGTSGSAGRGGGGTAGGSAGKGGSSGKAGGTGDSGEAGIGSGATGGSSNGGNGGSSTGGNGGTGTSGDTSTGGSAGEPPMGCTDISDCTGAKPICDDGTCRACSPGAMPDECADLTSTPLCGGMSGRCVECLGNDDCDTSSRSVCDDGTCRGCLDGSECESGACAGGRCAPESSVVYALAGTGSYDADCGTFTKPCIRLSDAAIQLNGGRPYLVLIKTTLTFNETLALPPMVDGLTVVGNHVPIQTYQAPAITISGGSVFLDDVVVESDAGATYSGDLYTVSAVDTTLKIRKGSFTNLFADFSAVTLRLVNSSADIHEAEFIGGRQGLSSTSTLTTASQSLTVENCVFERNRQALNFEGGYFIIRNNLFISNGQDSYVRIIRLVASQESLFAFNTLYGNDNNCSYEGGLIACEGGAAACGTHTSNLFWNNMYGASGLGPCPDQVYASGPSINYTIAEAIWPGIGNTSDDPLLVDAPNGDYTPGSGSPAIDKAESDPAVMPVVDHFGLPRPVGSDPDIGAIEVQ